jgi:hypothetical protein
MRFTTCPGGDRVALPVCPRATAANRRLPSPAWTGARMTRSRLPTTCAPHPRKRVAARRPLQRLAGATPHLPPHSPRRWRRRLAGRAAAAVRRHRAKSTMSRPSCESGRSNCTRSVDRSSHFGHEVVAHRSRTKRWYRFGEGVGRVRLRGRADRRVSVETIRAPAAH